MATSQTAVSREVQRWMAENRLSQAQVGAVLGVSQVQVSARLRGVTNWSLDDLDKLWELGVPITLPTYQGADR